MTWLKKNPKKLKQGSRVQSSVCHSFKVDTLPPGQQGGPRVLARQKRRRWRGKKIHSLTGTLSKLSWWRGFRGSGFIGAGVSGSASYPSSSSYSSNSDDPQLPSDQSSASQDRWCCENDCGLSYRGSFVVGSGNNKEVHCVSLALVHNKLGFISASYHIRFLCFKLLHLFRLPPVWGEKILKSYSFI